MSTAKQEAQLVVNQYEHLRGKVERLQEKDRAGTASMQDAAFLAAFTRQLREVALEVVHAKMSSGVWDPEQIIERMSA